MSLAIEKYAEGALEADNTLLELCYSYYLILKDYNEFGDLGRDIAVPLRWNDLAMRLERTDSHGVVFTRGKDGDEIGFGAGEGQEEIESFYALYGPDGIGYVQEFISNGVDDVINYEAQISLKDRRVEGQITYLKITRKSLRDKLLNRWDTVVDLADTKALDTTTTLTPPTVRDISLPSVGLNQKYKAENMALEAQDFEVVYQGGAVSAGFLYIHMNTLNPVFNDIEQHFGYPLSVFTSPPTTSDLYNWKMRASGDYHFQISLNFDLNVFLHRSNDFNRPYFEIWEMRFFLSIDGVQTQIGTTVTGPTVNNQELGLKNLTATYDDTVYIREGAKVYLYGQFQFMMVNKSTKKISALLRFISFSYQVDAVTTATPSIAKGLYVFDTLEGLTRSVTDNEIGVKSNLYSRSVTVEPDNCGAYRAILTGIAARGATEKVVPKLSLQDTLKSLKAIDCIGWNLEYDADDGEALVINPIDYFYTDNEILYIDKIQNFVEQTQSAMLYQKVQVGYKKYADEGEQAKEDYNTIHTYQTPLRQGEGTYEAISDLCGSGILLEQVRRNKIAEGEETSGNSDDDTNFIVCVKPQSYTAVSETLEFRAVYRQHYEYDPETGASTLVDDDPGNSFLIVDKPDFMVVGAVMTITGSLLNNGTYNIVNFEYISDISKWAITVTESISIESAILCLIGVVSYPLVPETNEDFDVTAGLASPQTAINLRINPKYMLANHGLLLNSSLSYKTSGDKLKATEVKQNVDMVIQREEAEYCTQGDTGRSQFRMGDDVQLSKLTGFTRLFTPEKVSFTTPFSYEQFMYIVNRHIGKEAGDAYGYLRVATPCGDDIAAYVHTLEFDPIRMQMTCELLKKKS